PGSQAPESAVRAPEKPQLPDRSVSKSHPLIDAHRPELEGERQNSTPIGVRLMRVFRVASAARARNAAKAERLALAPGLHEPALAVHLALEEAGDDVDRLLHGEDRQPLAQQQLADRPDDLRLGESGADRIDPDAVAGEDRGE